MRNQGPNTSSCNAGELAPDLAKKVGLKQFYAGALKMKNIEPVPQSGFRLGPGTAYVDDGRAQNIRFFCLKVSTVLSYMLVFTDEKCDIYRVGNRTKVFTITNSAIWGSRLQDYDFYGEANTVGMFHKDDSSGIRIFRNNETDWTLDDWPYETRPKVDLGGTYSKTQDRWEIYLRYVEALPRLTVQLTVNGEQTETVDFVDGGGTRISPDGATDGQYDIFAANIQTALRALPSLNSDVNCTYLPAMTGDEFRVLRVDFTSSLAGVEYEFDCQVVNTSEASTLVGHTRIGSTDFENLVSGSQGGFAGMTLYQDRAVYYAPAARQLAIAMSKVGEYFDLDIDKEGDADARLEAIRSQSNQRILHVVEDAYLLVFTNEAEYFINNRVIKRSEPLNFVEASRIGTRKGVKPARFDGRMLFVDKTGSNLHSIQYDAVKENYYPPREDLLAQHLIVSAKRMVSQGRTSGSVAPRLWVLRDDGRLVEGVKIESEDINALCEWVAADSGQVLEIELDGDDGIWMAIKRGSDITIEVMEEASSNLFQCAIDTTTNLVGEASGLSKLNGRTVWARINGHVDGPFVVSGGKIQTDFPSANAKVGLWQPPLYESMPYWRVLPNDEILERPSRIHTVTLNLISTESVALGVNGRTAKDVPLVPASADLDQPAPLFSGQKELAGLIGVATGPTVTITQTRPGRLRVRDFTPGIKF